MGSLVQVSFDLSLSKPNINSLLYYHSIVYFRKGEIWHLDEDHDVVHCIYKIDAPLLSDREFIYVESRREFKLVDGTADGPVIGDVKTIFVFSPTAEVCEPVPIFSGCVRGDIINSGFVIIKLAEKEEKAIRESENDQILETTVEDLEEPTATTTTVHEETSKDTTKKKKKKKKKKSKKKNANDDSKLGDKRGYRVIFIAQIDPKGMCLSITNYHFVLMFL
jgi:hypothetical protein